LSQNYPNSFNPSTTIEFTLPKSEIVELKVFNILGKEVTTLVSRKLNQGNHTYQFDGKNLASGIYNYKIVAGDPSTGLPRAESRGLGQRYREVKKMILLR
jgi:flagellar hook assembly protein FlgD